MNTFGIDLGTTNSVIARLIDGAPTAVAVDGSAIVPSVIYYGPDGVRVGREARNIELQHPERTLRSVKRRMGTDHRFDVDGRSVTPEEASAEILRALKEGAERTTGEAVRDVVITVPAYFDEAQRKATLRAGTLAGLNVLRLLNEPTAASLVYDRVGPGSDTPQEDPERVLVYDLGGGTFDVSVLEVFGEIREVRSTTGNTHLGGDDFDEKLVQHFLDELKVHGADPRDDVRAMARLRRVAEETKIRLSSELEAVVREEFVATHEGRALHLDLTVTRREFEAMIEPLLASTVTLAEAAVRDAGLDAAALGRICLVGGSTRIPRVRELLEAAFGAPVHEEIDVDLAVGLGASVQAGLLAGEEVGRILVDVASHSLGVAVVGNDDFAFGASHFLPIIGRNTVLPAARTQEIYTMFDDQEKYLVQVFQGEGERVADNTSVGEFMSELEPRPEGSPVRVKFEYDLNGMVKVSVSQPGAGKLTVQEISVANASSAGAPAVRAAAPKNTLERKAHALLEKLTGKPKAALQGLLDAYGVATGGAREAAEEALLDFIVDHGDE
jgi:molecular chaperone DnaK